jgi:hypothetical protein
VARGSSLALLLPWQTSELGMFARAKLLLLLLTAPLGVQSWGREGHQVVSEHLSRRMKG